MFNILEGTPEVEARKFGAIVSSENPNGKIKVWGFDPVDKPTVRLACMLPNQYAYGYSLYLNGVAFPNLNFGYAFGVLDSTKDLPGR